MKEVAHLPGKSGDLRGIDAEPGQSQIPLDGDQLLAVPTAGAAQRLETRARAGARQHVDAFAACRQQRDEVPTDETGASGNEIRHICCVQAFLRDATPCLPALRSW